MPRWLTDEDHDLIKEVVLKVLKDRNNEPYRDPVPGLQAAPDNYVVKVPTAGIPARVSDTVGKVECEIYRVPRPGETPTLAGITLHGSVKAKREIHNLSPAVVKAVRSPYGFAERDKHGHFFFRNADPAGMHVALIPGGGIPARVGGSLGSASCSILKVDSGGLSLISTSETVYNIYPFAHDYDADDPYRSVFQDKFGDWLVERPPDVESGVSQYAKMVGFSISNQSGGMMSSNDYAMWATLDTWFDGIQPPLTGGQILVHDFQRIFPLAVAGARGFAVRHDSFSQLGAPYYIVTECDQMAHAASATIIGTLAADTFAVPIDSFWPDSQAPFGLMAIEPFKSVAYNPHKKRGVAGMKVALRWGFARDSIGQRHAGYYIESIDQQTFLAPGKFRVAPDKQIQMVRLPIGIETDQNLNNIDWEKMFPSQDC